MATRISRMVARYQGLAPRLYVGGFVSTGFSQGAPVGYIHRGFAPVSRRFHGGSVGFPLRTLEQFSPVKNFGASPMDCRGTLGAAYWNSSCVSTRLSSTISGKAAIDESESISSSDAEKSIGLKEEMAITQPAEHNDLEKLNEKGMLNSSYWGLSPAKAVREDGSPWPWNSFRPWETYTSNLSIDLKKHHVPKTFTDKVAYWTVKTLRFPTDVFFQGSSR